MSELTIADQKRAEAILLKVLQEMKLHGGETVNLHPNMTNVIATALQEERERAALIADANGNLLDAIEPKVLGSSSGARLAHGIATAIRGQNV